MEFELQDQPRRWLEDHRVMGKGEGDAWLGRCPRQDGGARREGRCPRLPLLPRPGCWCRWSWTMRGGSQVQTRVPELPMAPLHAVCEGLWAWSVKEAWALVEERDACLFYEACVTGLAARGLDSPRAGKLAANILLQSGAKRANEQGTSIDKLGITPQAVAAIGKLKEDGKLGTAAVDELFGLLCNPPIHNRQSAIARRGDRVARQVQGVSHRPRRRGDGKVGRSGHRGQPEGRGRCAGRETGRGGAAGGRR